MLSVVGMALSAPLLPAAHEEKLIALTYFFYCLESEIPLILIPANMHKEKIVPGRKQKTFLYEFIKMICISA